MQLFEGEVDGKDSAALRTAVALYKRKQSLIADRKLDDRLYGKLLADKTPIDKDFMPLVVREYVDMNFSPMV